MAWLGEFLGTLLASGIVSAGALFALFKIFGEKWLDAKFEQRLAKYKHEHDQEIERLRGRINALMDRTIKLHQHEFETLPQVWSRLNDAFGLTQSQVASFQSYPDLSGISADHLDEFLNTTPLHNWEKVKLKTAEDPSKYYQERIFWHRLSDAKTACREHYSYLRRGGIFILQDLRERFYELNTLMWEALTEHETNHSMDLFPRMHKKLDAFRTKGPELLRDLEQQVQKRLWNSQSIAS
jgi:hypothetical protein